MGLVIDLKPGEKIIVGEAVITNDKQRTRLHISGDAPILREKDILKDEEADTPCKKIYCMVELMYLSKSPQDHYESYFEMIKEIQEAAPSTTFFFMKINDYILNGKYYKALKESKQLIEHEKELLESVK